MINALDLISALEKTFNGKFSLKAFPYKAAYELSYTSKSGLFCVCKISEYLITDHNYIFDEAEKLVKSVEKYEKELEPFEKVSGIGGFVYGNKLSSGLGAIEYSSSQHALQQQQALANQQNTLGQQQNQHIGQLNGLFKDTYGGLQGFGECGAGGAGGGGGGIGPFILPSVGPFSNLKEKKDSKPTKGKTMLGHLRDYLGKNRDIIFNVALIVLVDHFVFGGAFREKIKNLLDGLLVKTHKMLDADHDAKSTPPSV